MRTTEVRPPAARGLLGALLAPLVWLERARGRWRLALLLAYSLVVVVVAAWTWRATCLWGLPDIGDPCAVAVSRARSIPPDENAFTDYEQAVARLRAPRDPETGADLAGEYSWVAWIRGGVRWKQADPKIRAWLECNREALGLWRRGTARRRAWPRGEQPTVRWSAFGSLDLFGPLACLEGSRLEERGDLAGAWGWYNAALRASRHANTESDAPSRALAWASDPRVDAALLRRALRDVLALDAIDAPEAQIVRQLYLAARERLRKELDSFASDPEVWLLEHRAAEAAWYRHLAPVDRLRCDFRREPERSLRVLRLAFANWLAHRQSDPLAPPALGGMDLVLWGTTPAAPAPTRALAPEELARWYDSTVVLKRIGLPEIWRAEGQLNKPRADRARLIVSLAEQLYERERGQPPASPRDLVGPYLDRLPEGLDPGPTVPNPNSPW